jgi:hypothetical protein
MADNSIFKGALLALAGRDSATGWKADTAVSKRRQILKSPREPSLLLMVEILPPGAGRQILKSPREPSLLWLVGILPPEAERQILQSPREGRYCSLQGSPPCCG